MRTQLLDENNGRRTFVLVFDIGEEAVGGLRRFAAEQKLAASHFTAIGAFQDAVLGYWRWESKEYSHIPVREQVEVVSLIGDLTLAPDGSPQVHAHVVLGKPDATALGGHLLEGHVRPTLEVFLTESPTKLRREYDEATGLALLRPE